MKLSAVASAIALATAVSAGTTDFGILCISQQEAERYIKTFVGVLAKTDPNATETADRIIADDFVLYSNSILSLQHKPIGPGDNVAAPSKAAWTQRVLRGPQIRGINTQGVVAGCNHIVWKWTFLGVGSAKYPVNGYNYFAIKRKGRQLQAQRLDLEFDSIAWGLDTGIKLTYRDGTALP